MSEQLDLAAIARKGERLEDWVVIIEATTDRRDDSFDFGGVQDLLSRLREWHASGLYNPARYAIQVHIAAASPYAALRSAVGYHDLAARAVGLTTFSLTRAEVLTLGEFESELLVPQPATGTPLSQTHHALISNQLYNATRALFRVSSRGEITDVLVRFVIAVGGSVNVGACRPVAGMISVDLSVGGGDPLYAVAEHMSVAGMIIEQSLPALVEDARLVLRQLQEARG